MRRSKEVRRFPPFLDLDLNTVRRIRFSGAGQQILMQDVPLLSSAVMESGDNEVAVAVLVVDSSSVEEVEYSLLLLLPAVDPKNNSLFVFFRNKLKYRAAYRSTAAIIPLSGAGAGGMVGVGVGVSRGPRLAYRL